MILGENIQELSYHYLGNPGAFIVFCDPAGKERLYSAPIVHVDGTFEIVNGLGILFYVVS